MANIAPVAQQRAARPEPAALLELTKPITWFPPMWAFLCGAVSSGQPLSAAPLTLALGVLLVGPMVCGASQVVNDWYDRDVDAINEPGRPIPSGRVPGTWGWYFALFWTLLAAGVGALLGPWVLGATLLALMLAWQYSAPPLRLKRNGWWGNLAVGISYEGLAWLTGAAILLGGAKPAPPVLIVAGLYSLGAHGIMTLNDFKSVNGDRRMGIRSLPARYGVALAARIACWVMLLPQLAVIALLWFWDCPLHAAGVAALVALQIAAMPRLLRRPRAMAPWYNGVGVTLYVAGMMVSATALGSLSGAAG